MKMTSQLVLWMKYECEHTTLSAFGLYDLGYDGVCERSRRVLLAEPTAAFNYRIDDGEPWEASGVCEVPSVAQTV